MDTPTIITTDNLKIKKGLYVSLACTHCRTNHRRCNGETPCSRCVKLDLQCIYEKTKPRGGYRGKKNSKNKVKRECDAVSSPCMESKAIVLPRPTSSISALVSYYSGTYYQTIDFRLCPLWLPNLDETSAPEKKFRVFSCVGYAALTVGHIEQGHVFMDQAKQYLPQAMSSITMDAALGFYHLGLSHLMEQDNESGVNYLKVCKSLASTIYNTQRSQGKVDLFVTGAHESNPIPQSIALKLRYYYAMITSPASITELHKRLNSLAKLTEKWDGAMSSMFNMTKTIINLRYCGTEEELLSAIDSIEQSAKNFGPSLDHISPIYVHMFRAMKFAFLGDYGAMSEECDRFIGLFKSLQVHDLTTIKMAYLVNYLWGTFDIPSIKIQELVTHAHQLSVNFPGYKALSVKHTKYQDPLGMLLQRRLTCSEESMMPSNVVDPFANADVLVFDNMFDELLEVTF